MLEFCVGTMAVPEHVWFLPGHWSLLGFEMGDGCIGEVLPGLGEV